MKLTCDICNHELQMNLGGLSAICPNCGISYSIERLREKLGEQQTVPTNNTYEPTAQPQQYYEPAPQPQTQTNYVSPEQNYVPNPQPQPQAMRCLRIKRKTDLHLCKIAIVIDNQAKYILEGQGKETIVPITAGTHIVFAQIASGSGMTTTEPVQIVVGNYDYYGEVGLKRGIFSAKYVLQLLEMNR